jgi:hypothetical protein
VGACARAPLTAARPQALLNDMAKVDLTGKGSNTKNGLKRKALQVGRAAARQ